MERKYIDQPQSKGTPKARAALNFISGDDLVLKVSTNGTKAAPGNKLVNWKITWGDGNYTEGNNNPPTTTEHCYEIEGEYETILGVSDSKNNLASDNQTMLVRGPLPLPVIDRGPSPAITCPVGSVAIPVGSTTASRQVIINAAPLPSTFCIAAGIHTANGSNTPRTGDTYVGQYGATIDGTGWVSGDATQAVFRAHNQDIDNVTIKNLIIQNVPQRAVHAFTDFSSGWTVENCTLSNGQYGFTSGSNTTVKNSIIHDFVIAGLAGGGAYPAVITNILIQNNEIYNCGNGSGVQKYLDCTAITWKDNYIHNCSDVAIWNDGVGDGSIIERNTIDTCQRGVMLELCENMIVRNNTISNCSEHGIFISTSNRIEMHNNTINDNLFGIVYFVDCGAVGSFPWLPDLYDNYAHDNDVRVPTTPGAFGSLFNYTGCSAAQLIPYESNTKNNRFNFNHYRVPSLSGFYWIWVTTKDFSGWQALPQDASGSVGL